MTALDHFAAKLAFETDVSDVQAALPGAGFVLVDSRGAAAWAQGHIPGARHLPTASIAERAADLVPVGTPVVTYCWGPGCNGATRAALEFARLGYPVREMIGGFEYWAREGFAVETAAGVRPGRPDAHHRGGRRPLRLLTQAAPVLAVRTAQRRPSGQNRVTPRAGGP